MPSKVLIGAKKPLKLCKGQYLNLADEYDIVIDECFHGRTVMENVETGNMLMTTTEFTSFEFLNMKGIQK